MTGKKTAFLWTFCGGMSGALLGGVGGAFLGGVGGARWASTESGLNYGLKDYATAALIGVVLGFIPSLLLGGLSAKLHTGEAGRVSMDLHFLLSAVLIFTLVTVASSAFQGLLLLRP